MNGCRDRIKSFSPGNFHNCLLNFPHLLQRFGCFSGDDLFGLLPLFLSADSSSCLLHVAMERNLPTTHVVALNSTRRSAQEFSSYFSYKHVFAKTKRKTITRKRIFIVSSGGGKTKTKRRKKESRNFILHVSVVFFRSTHLAGKVPEDFVLLSLY